MLMVLPTRTHVYGLAPVGWALRAAGHDVRYVGQRNPTEIAPFLDTGLEAMWFGEEVDIARHRRASRSVGVDNIMDSRYKISESRPERYTDEYIRTVYDMWAATFRMAAPDSLLDDLLVFARQWKPDLVIWDPVIYAAPLIAHAVGAAQVRMLIATDQTARLTFQYREMMCRLDPSGSIEDPMVAWMSAWLARHGREFDERLRFGMATIDPSPSCMRYDLDVNYIPVRFVPVNRPLTVPRWVVEKPRRPRICLTLGVSTREVHGPEETSVTALLDGLADLDVEVVATLNADQLVGVRVPNNVRVVDFAPLNELLASCSAIIHQGGGATIGNAVVNGVPQLVIPGNLWSERVSGLAQEKRGYGLILELDEVTPASVRNQVHRLLHEPSFAECAADVQQEMLATRTVLDTVADLERIAASHQS